MHHKQNDPTISRVSTPKYFVPALFNDCLDFGLLFTCSFATVSGAGATGVSAIASGAIFDIDIVTRDYQDCTGTTYSSECTTLAGKKTEHVQRATNNRHVQN